MAGWNAGKRRVRMYPPPDWPEEGEEVLTLLSDDEKPFECEMLMGEVDEADREEGDYDGLREFSEDQIKEWVD